MFILGEKFQAQIRIPVYHEGKRVCDKKIHLGLFETSKEAAIAWDRGAVDAGRPTSSLNFPVYDVGSVGGGGVHDDLVTTTAAAAADTDCNVERKKAGGALPDGHTCI